MFYGDTVAPDPRIQDDSDEPVINYSASVITYI